MLGVWRNLSVTKKLYAVVGIMAVLIASELVTLLFAMTTLSSVRAFVAGEGLWSKAQKDAIQSLYHYAFTGDEHKFADYQHFLTIPDGDHAARIELQNPNFDREIVRRGFLKGGNHEDDIDGMINLLVRFHSVTYISSAIQAWNDADAELDHLRATAKEIDHVVRNEGISSVKLPGLLERLSDINSRLTKVELAFSSSLGAGSRWLEYLLTTILALTVLTIESTGLFLTFRFVRHMSRSMAELSATAVEVAKGDFSVSAPVRSWDEFGRLADLLNKMIVALKINVDKRTSAEATVRRADERFRLLIDAVNDYAIYMVDPSGVVTTWNSGAKNLTGYEADEVIGKPSSIFMTETDPEHNIFQFELDLAVSVGRSERDFLRMKKDGTTFWAKTITTPMYDDAGSLAGFTKVICDLTERRRVEQQMSNLNTELEHRVEERTHEIHARESQLRLIANSLPILVAQLDKNERLLFANDAFCHWFMRPVDQVIGRSLRAVIGDDKYPENEPHIREVMAGQVTSYERRSVVADRVVIYGITLVPEYDPQHDNVVGFVLVASDITKHKEIEAELIQATKHAEIANATKSAFLANMSHEIRTPISAILGFSELMVHSEMNKGEKLNAMEIIRRNGKLLTNIIDDILDLSKVEAGKLEIQLGEVSLNEIVDDIRSSLNLKAQEKGVSLIVTTMTTVPSLIKTDPLRLRQILLNVIGNAVKFTDKGRVEVNIGITNEGAKGAKLSFVVKDTGKGISRAQADRLFTPFTQADVSTTRQFGGTGLGLILSKRLANALGGDVVLKRSLLGVGSIFVVSIDVGTNASKAPRETTVQMNVSDLVPVLLNTPLVVQLESPPRIDHAHVLLVDDSPDIRLLMTRFLRNGGATVDTAKNGQEALDMALGKDYSIVLMDLQMPIMDGYTALRELRKRNYRRPVVALTAHAMSEERKRCLDIGFDEHVSKPVSRTSLLQVVARFSALSPLI